MTLNPRQSDLLDEVRRRGTASVEALAEHFGVTLQTVRRDVKLLQAAGALARFHGGVRMPASATSTTENIAYRQRRQLNEAAKQRIAQAVARAVPDGCSLMLNIGTTTEAIARALLRHRGLRVITNNLNVAAILSDNADCELIVAGGVVRPRDRAILGEATVDFIRQFKVDIGLIGISGLEADGTLRDFDYREVKVAKSILEHSREVWLAADFSKFNRPAMVELGRLEQIDRLFTDQPPPEPFPQLLEAVGVVCVVADGPEASGQRPTHTTDGSAASEPAADAQADVEPPGPRRARQPPSASDTSPSADPSKTATP
ncbi:MAG: DeoR family transcriptional regulator [Rhizobacter sp.]|nr:DeoR family transcriptional regulator [Rhizobacter sp.]